MKAIRFAHDWNGKVTGIQKVFTTIRKCDNAKRKYYEDAVGETFEVMLGKQIKVGEAKLISAHAVLYDMIQVQLLQVDTGYTDLEKVRKLFKNFGIDFGDTVLLLLFEKNLNYPV